jgi:hypothetical protein
MATRPWLRTASLLILFAAYFCPITYAATKDTQDAQLVRLRYVQGDVRFNRGNGKHPDLKQPWEVAITNLPIEQNYALATGDGRAEIEFEDGSVVYVAENTVMLFDELTSTDDVPATTLELVSGTITADYNLCPMNLSRLIRQRDKLPAVIRKGPSSGFSLTSMEWSLLRRWTPRQI